MNLKPNNVFLQSCSSKNPPSGLHPSGKNHSVLQVSEQRGCNQLQARAALAPPGLPGILQGCTYSTGGQSRVVNVGRAHPGTQRSPGRELTGAGGERSEAGDAGPAAVPKGGEHRVSRRPLAARRGFPGFIKEPSILGRIRLVCSAASCSHKPPASERDPSVNELSTKRKKMSLKIFLWQQRVIKNNMIPGQGGIFSSQNRAGICAAVPTAPFPDSSEDQGTTAPRRS